TSGGAGWPANRGARPAGWYGRRHAADPGGSAADDSWRAAGGVYRARRALRELYPSADHPLNAALGRRWCLAGHPVDGRAVQPYLAARIVPLDWRGQEKRHFDDRSGAGTGAHGRPESRGLDPPRLPAAFSPHPDDYTGRDPRRLAAAAGHGRRRGNAPATGPGHCWRSVAQPSADLVQHAGGLSVL